LQALKEMLASKKFLTAVAAMIVAAVAKLGLELETGAVYAILSPLVAYILGQGVADAGKSVEIARLRGGR
jgi:predicted transcriptional regulator